MVTCKDCEFGGSCVLLHKSNSQTCNIFTHKKDYVEVVRCKDCKHEEYCVRRIQIWGRNSMPGLYAAEYHPLSFCSYGERREGE